jgi:DNA-binding NarL/FixJ family response regulator
MPQLNGIEAARILSKSLPKAKIVFVTMHSDATFVNEALKAGASGYVLKRSAPEELVTAIEEVLRGRMYITPLVTRGFVDSVLPPYSSGEPFGRLTGRQREVLQLVAEGQSIKTIAATLLITPKTVEFHKANLMRALGLRSTAELVKYAIKHGIASVEDF